MKTTIFSVCSTTSCSTCRRRRTGSPAHMSRITGVRRRRSAALTAPPTAYDLAMRAVSDSRIDWLLNTEQSARDGGVCALAPWNHNSIPNTSERGKSKCVKHKCNTTRRIDVGCVKRNVVCGVSQQNCFSFPRSSVSHSFVATDNKRECASTVEVVCNVSCSQHPSPVLRQLGDM